MKPTLRPELGPLPVRMRNLPLDERGYPVPWFVGFVDGKPEFRAADAVKWKHAVRDRVCWVCGNTLGVYLAFVIGPMCAVNRVTSEPACHLECASWSVKNCPFLTRPHMVRRENDLPEGFIEPAGVHEPRNPGVMALWITRTYTVFKATEGNKGWLIRISPPERVEWWREGRPATRVEVEQVVNDGVTTNFRPSQLDPKEVAVLTEELTHLRAHFPPA